MEEYQLNRIVTHKLNEFDSLGNILPSEEWNRSLMKRISEQNPSATSRISSAKFGFAVLFIILVNVGFFLNSIIRDSHLTNGRDKALMIISKELLVNPASINN
jgi:hypothetical protein